MHLWRISTLAVLIGGMATGIAAEPSPATDPGAKQEAKRLDSLPPVPPAPPGHIDRSGRKESGRASYYAKGFAHRKMADGRRMNPNSNIAASKTLPLGSVAKVTNLSNGKTAIVKIEDRGPYVGGRVVDLAHKVADQLELKEKGVVPVEVKPITVPQAGGDMKLGAGAAEASPEEVSQAIEVTRELTAPKTAETAEK